MIALCNTLQHTANKAQRLNEARQRKRKGGKGGQQQKRDGILDCKIEGGEGGKKNV